MIPPVECKYALPCEICQIVVTQARLCGPFSYGEHDMTLASLRDGLRVPFDWIAMRISAWPKALLIMWGISLALAAWIF